MKAYKFSELSEEAQEKALQNHRWINVDDCSDWSDHVRECEAERLAALGYEDAKVWFRGFCSKGDGACFDATVDSRKLFLAYAAEMEEIWKHSEERGFDVAKTNKLVRILRNRRDLMADIASNEVSFEIGRTSCATHYCHENARDIEATFYGTSQYKLIDLVLTEFAAWVEEHRRSQSQEIYTRLEKEHDFLTTDQSVKETIEALEMDFTEDGEDLE